MQTEQGKGAGLRFAHLLYPVEVLVLWLTVGAIVLLALAGRRFCWLLPDSLLLVGRMAAWVFPNVVICYLAAAFGWRAGLRRGLMLAYYALLTAGLIGCNLAAALVRSQLLSRAGAAFYQIAPVNVACALILLAAVPLGWRRRGRIFLQEWGQLSREFLRALRLCISLVFLFVAYSNLKAAVPLLRPGLYDHLLYRLDRMLFFGFDPLKFVGSLRIPWLVTLMQRSYYFLFFFILFGLSGSLFFRSSRYMAKVLLAFALVYAVGLVGYYLVPSVGPAFYNATSGFFRHTAHSTLKMWLYNAYVEFCRHPHTAPIAPFSGLAAFPSLHLAQMAVFLYYLWECEKWLVALLALPALLLSVATVYLGWHYVVDLPAGLLVAAVAVGLAERIHRAWPQPMRPETEPANESRRTASAPETGHLQ